MKKVAFYGRYSSAHQTEQSIEGQLHVCEKYAAENDMEIIGQYIDRATTGTTDNRAEFQRMIADSASGEFECVLVYKFDRFARNRYDSAIYKKKLRDNGVRVVSATEMITDTPEGIIMEGLLEAMDEYYSAELGRKMRRGKEESFRKGRYLSSAAPFGYKIVDHRLAVDDATAPIAQEIFQRYADGERQAGIISDLNQRGIPNSAGRKWNKVNITIMLRNRIYMGVYSISTMEGEVPCPAIISQEVFDKVQKQREIAIHKARERRTRYDYILTGKAICADCGAHLRGVSSFNHKLNKYYRYYQCHKHHGHCYPADELHDIIRDALHEYLTEDKADELASAAYAEYVKEEAPASEQKLLEQELAEVEKKLENAVSAVLNGYGSETLKKSMQELEKRKTELTENLKAVSVKPPQLTQEHFRCALELLIEKAETDDLKELMNTVVNRIILDNQKVIICINLTDESNEPPLRQVLYKVKDNPTSLIQNKITFVSGWMYIAA